MQNVKEFLFFALLQPTFGSWTNERIDRSACAPFSLSRRQIEIQAHGFVSIFQPSRVVDEANDLFSVDIHPKTSCYATLKSGTVLMDFLEISFVKRRMIESVQLIIIFGNPIISWEIKMLSSRAE